MPKKPAPLRPWAPNVRDDGEFFLALLQHFDRDLHWHYVAANKDPEVIKQLLLHPQLLPGFMTAAYMSPTWLFSMATYARWKIGLEDSEQGFSHMLKRLTREPAEFFGLNVGGLEVGDPADFALLDPQRLASYDGEASVQYTYRKPLTAISWLTERWCD